MIDSHIHLGSFREWYFYNVTSTVESINKLFKDFDGIVITTTDAVDNKGVFKALKSITVPHKFAVWATPCNETEVRSFEFDQIKIHPAFSRVSFSDPLYDYALELAEVRDVPIMVHTGGIPLTDYHHVIERAEEYPKINFIIGHMGGRLYQHQWNCPIDVKSYKNIYVDTTMKILDWTLEHCERTIGSARMLFGSDYPIMHPNVGIEAIRSAKLNFDDIVHNTAEKLFLF
jgi:hypothetical protein|tara:strand:+ start:14418 stop:15107 length:690 start_codon:yes stop_codon:yes gene_type:complete